MAISLFINVCLIWINTLLILTIGSLKAIGRVLHIEKQKSRHWDFRDNIEIRKLTIKVRSQFIFKYSNTKLLAKIVRIWICPTKYMYKYMNNICFYISFNVWALSTLRRYLTHEIWWIVSCCTSCQSDV